MYMYVENVWIVLSAFYILFPLLITLSKSFFFFVRKLQCWPKQVNMGDYMSSFAHSPFQI